MPSALLRELRLHGLTRITDDALSPMSRVPLPFLGVVGLTCCSRLTVDVRRHLPPSVRELHVAGCQLMSGSLDELSAYTLDVHVCPHGLRAVEEQAREGFRFLCPALRAGVRLGSTCCAGQVCAFCPDARFETWHASLADWSYAR